MTRVSAAHGLDWIVAGARYLPRAWRPLLLLSAMLLGATMLAMALASLRHASVLFGLLGVFYLATLARICRALDDGAVLSLAAQLRLSGRSRPLWLLAAISAGLTLALDLLGYSMAAYAHAAAWSGLGWYFLFVKLLSLLAIMALWLAPALLVTQQARPLQAMRISLLATLNNVLPCGVFGLLAFVLCIVAAIPLGLGLLAAVPALACGAALAARDLCG